MSALKYWLWISSLRSLGAEKVAALIDALGNPENVYFAGEDEWKAAVDLSDEAICALSDKSMERSERILENCEITGTKILTMQDASYPERLRNIYEPPSVLYYKGTLPSMDEEAALGVVGTRRPTAYGTTAATEICYSLAKAGMLIVSGMAEGIDGAGARGALRAGKPTIALLGSGPDIAYPAMHRSLYEDIIALGAVVSEYPPGTPVEGRNFPRRNRLISGLSLGVLVIEAPLRSGSLITASHALEQGRDVFAVPGNIDSRESEGSNRLCREGAVLVTCAGDILIEYKTKFAHKLSVTPPPPPTRLPAPPQFPRAEQRKKEIQPVAIDLTEKFSAYEPEQQQILFAVAGTSMVADQIMEVTGLPAQIVLSELTLLEVDGIIKALPGNRYALALGD